MSCHRSTTVNKRQKTAATASSSVLTALDDTDLDANATEDLEIEDDQQNSDDNGDKEDDNGDEEDGDEDEEEGNGDDEEEEGEEEDDNESALMHLSDSPAPLIPSKRKRKLGKQDSGEHLFY